MSELLIFIWGSSRDFLCGIASDGFSNKNILGRGEFGKVERVVEGEEARDVGGS
ncbi:unnamed protein product [Brassica rapa subsp. trilocularis]